MSRRLPVIIAVIIFLFPSLSNAQKETPITFNRQWAFLVGVGQYPAESGIGQLNSPTDGVKAMKQLLSGFGGSSLTFALAYINSIASNRTPKLALGVELGPDAPMVV